MAEYVVLRLKRSGRVNRFTEGTVRSAAATVTAEISQESLDGRHRTDLLRDPEVKGLAPTLRTRLIRPTSISDGRLGEIWGVEAVRADTSPFDGSGVTVAVLDTGIDRTHPAFAGVTLVEQDFSRSGDGDRNGHGTHCAGTIFGRDVERQRIGIARGVTRALVAKVLDDEGSGNTEMLFRAMQWAYDQRAQVLSMSLGFDVPGQVKALEDRGWPSELAASAALEGYRENLRVFDTLMDFLRAQSRSGPQPVVLAATGNESRRTEDPEFRIGASLPAAASHVISVAAVGRHGSGLAVADFSNARARVCAPGVDIVSAAPGGGLATMSGTSMATPHAAGVAALWAQALSQSRAGRTGDSLGARITGNLRHEPFGDTYDAFDLGDGLVTAPQAGAIG